MGGRINQRWWLTHDSVELWIDADAHLLYSMVSDLPRIGEWSPECERVEWEEKAPGPFAGTAFVGHSAVGPGRRLRYTRHGRIFMADAGREFAFVTYESGRQSTVWRYCFESLETGGTRVTESYEVRWIPLWARILEVPLNRHQELLRGMRTTLERLKATAEARPRVEMAPLRVEGNAPHVRRAARSVAAYA
jgi:hypothetical protein